jgi:hypothetical protein
VTAEVLDPVQERTGPSDRSRPKIVVNGRNLIEQLEIVLPTLASDNQPRRIFARSDGLVRLGRFIPTRVTGGVAPVVNPVTRWRGSWLSVAARFPPPTPRCSLGLGRPR